MSLEPMEHENADPEHINTWRKITRITTLCAIGLAVILLALAATLL